MAEPIYLDEQRITLDDEERERERRALEAMQPPTALDVMEAPRMHEGAPITVTGPGDPAAAARAQSIADTDPAEWAAQRDRYGSGSPSPRPIELPEQQITGRPRENPALEFARQRAQRAPDPVETRAAVQRAARGEIEAPASTTDPALSRAVAESDKRRRIAAIASLLAGATGVSRAGFTQRAMQAVDPERPIARYQTERQVTQQEEAQRAAQERQVMEDRRRQQALDERALAREQDAALAQQRLGLQERQLEQRGAADERGARLDEARLGLIEAQRAAAAGDAEADAAMRDAASPISRGTQDLYLDMLRESRGGDVPPQIEAAVRSQPARVLMENDALRTSIQGGYSVRRSRRGGSGAGGGLGSRGRGASQALRHYQQALDVTGDPDAAAAATQEAFPGFEPPGGGQGEQLSPRQRSEAARWAQMNIAANIPEVLSMMRPAEQAIQGASDGEIREAVGIINGGTLTREVLRGASPRAAAIAQSVMQLSNVELRRVSGAAVSDQEFERFKQGIGTNSLSPDVLRRGLAAMRRNVEANARQIDAGFPGISDYVQRQREEARGGGQRRQGGGSRVRVRYQGRVLEIPRSRLEQAQADGAEVVE